MRGAFTQKEKQLFKKLHTPAKVQDFLNALPANFELHGETCKSPLRSIREKEIHCMEGAMLGAYILSLHGYVPYLLHLKAMRPDDDHVIAPFRFRGRWGALSKTNHAVLRYREPVYKTIRELAMSYFHEYFLNANGKKTLLSYSAPLSLKRFGKDWITSEEDLWHIDKALDRVRHFEIAPRPLRKVFRPAEKIERKAGSITEWKKKKH